MKNAKCRMKDDKLMFMSLLLWEKGDRVAVDEEFEQHLILAFSGRPGGRPLQYLCVTVTHIN